MSRRAARVQAGLLLPALLLACAGTDVRVESDPDEDFSRLRTYGWYRPQPPAGGARPDRDLRGAIQSPIESAIERRLEEKGFTPARGGKADLLVHYHLSLERRLETREMDAFYGGPTTSEWEAHGNVRHPGPVEHEVGTLVIDLLDGERGRLLWRGWSTRRLGKHPEPTEIEQSVESALSGFPPPASDSPGG